MQGLLMRAALAVICLPLAVIPSPAHVLDATEAVWEGRVLNSSSVAGAVVYDWNAVTFYLRVDAEAGGTLSMQARAGGKRAWIPFEGGRHEFVNRLVLKVLPLTPVGPDAARRTLELPAHNDETSVPLFTFERAGPCVISGRKMNQPNLVIGASFLTPDALTVLHFVYTPPRGGTGGFGSHSSTGLRRTLFPLSRRIAVWGASDSSGFGVDGNPASCKKALAELTNMYQNSDEAYGAVLARELQAELHMHAVAGIGAERNADWTAWWFQTFMRWLSDIGLIQYMQPLPSYFASTLGTLPPPAERRTSWAAAASSSAPPPTWDFGRWKPDAVLLMLGGNDKVCSSRDPGGPPLMPANFSQAYSGDVVARILTDFGRVNHTPTVISICGFSSESEDGSCNRNAACAAVSAAARSFNASYPRWAMHNFFLEVPVGVVADNETHGCDGHRTQGGQAAVAEYLLPRIRSIMGWRAEDAEAQ